MARLRSLIARPTAVRKLGIAALVAAVLLPVGLGCTSMKQTKKDVVHALRLDTTEPPSQMICFFQRRPQHLPDPTRDGVMSPGLVGQLFLISADNKPVEITGDLVVQGLDETKRPPGQPSATPEIWHIDKVALKKMRTNDDRFGPCYAIFLPWPSSWKDVTNVRMQAKYVNEPNPALFASDVQMTLEFGQAGASVWNEKGSFNPTASRPTSPTEMRGIPDFAKAMKNAQPMSLNQPPVYAGNTPTVTPPGMFLAPAPPGPPGVPGEYTAPGPDGSTVKTKVWTGPAPTVTPPSLQQTTFAPAQPIQPPSFNQPRSLHEVQLPPALPSPTTAPEMGLPPVNIPSLQPVVIPR